MWTQDSGARIRDPEEIKESTLYGDRQKKSGLSDLRPDDPHQSSQTRNRDLLETGILTLHQREPGPSKS